MARACWELCVVFGFCLLMPMTSWAQSDSDRAFNAIYQDINLLQYETSVQSALGDIEVTKIESDLFKREFDRGQLLFKKGSLTSAELRAREFKYQSSRNRIDELASQAQWSQTWSQISQLLIAQEDHPDQHYGIQISAKLKESVQHQLEGLLIAKAGAELSSRYHCEVLKEGESLYQRKVITLSEIERLRLNVETARLQIQSLVTQAESTSRTLERIGHRSS